MKKNIQFLMIAGVLLVITGGVILAQQATSISATPWSAAKAASYLDARMEWWLKWPQSQRDHDTACVSCHTALPYALARPALRMAAGETEFAVPERTLLANVIKRVKLWKDVEPFYPDQTRGLPKSSESRGTEAVMNALILATRDASTGVLSDDTRMAFANMWALQFKAGDLKGAWAWLNFRYEPWESADGPYFGAALAAIASGNAPGGYSRRPDVQAQMKLLNDYLQQRADTERLFNRVMVLLASANLPDLITPAQRTAIIDAIIGKQNEDGGWSLSALGSFKRSDSTAVDIASDGYATGLITFALQRTGLSHTGVHVGRGLTWLIRHQDSATGMWSASSLNKQRDPASDIGKFMNDAATAYAVLALTAETAQQRK